MKIYLIIKYTNKFVIFFKADYVMDGLEYLSVDERQHIRNDHLPRLLKRQ